MGYTEPKTWTNEPLVAADLNTHLRDNLDALKDPPFAVYNMVEGTDLTVSSTSFVDLDATDGKLELTITTTGGDVMICFRCTIRGGASTILFLDVSVDGTAYGVTTLGAADGLYAVNGLGTADEIDGSVLFWHIIPGTALGGIAAGSHTFRLRGKVDATGNVVIHRGAGTAAGDTAGQFWVREMS